MGTDAVGSASSSAAAQQWAAQQAAIEAARRAAMEAARRAAEAARRAAEAARRAAEEARIKAEAARKAAEEAQAQAAKSKAKADREEAARKAEAAQKAEALALKQEAIANLRSREEVLAKSKLEDVEQGRAAESPSEGTRAAQTEVDAAKLTASLYEANAAGAKKTPLDTARQKTQDLLDKAEKLQNKLSGIDARGDKVTKEQQAAWADAINDWLDAGEQQMRLAALEAQADGKDVNAAIDAERDKMAKALDKGGVFNPDAMGRFIKDVRDTVRSESGAVRQIRSEQYTVMHSGTQQLADARAAQPGLEAAADKAEDYAKRFTSATTDSQVTAQQAAQADAKAKRAAASEGEDRIKGLKLAYEGSIDKTDPAKSTLGTVETDYESRLADVNVREASAKYELAKAQGDDKKAEAAGRALDDAITQQTLVHADRDVAAAKLGLADSEAERDAVQDTYNARQDELKDQGNADPALTLDYNDPKTRDRVKLIDGKYYLITHHEPETRQVAAGKGGSVSIKVEVDDTRQELDPLSARMWAAQEKAAADGKRLDDAARVKTQAESDLLSPDKQTAATLDTGAWVNREAEFNQKLTDAQQAVAAAKKNLNDGLNTVGPVDRDGLRAKLGQAEQNLKVAEADVATVKAMRELRDAQRQEALGQVCMSPDAMATLRAKARDAVNQSRDAGPELTPENEAKTREDLKTQSDKLKAQDGVVAKAQADYDKAVGTDQEATKKKALDAAKAERSNLDRTVRGEQTLLDKIDADRLALAAPAEYAQHKFVKPQLSMFMRNGESTTGDLYSRDYNPTWSITPDADGKVKAEGLPKGLKPDDVEVKKEGGEWVVVFKKASDTLGYNADNKSLYRVNEGTVKMDQGAARLWETQAKAQEADKARKDYLNEVKDIGVPTKPSADGRPPVTLSFDDDLVQRRQDVHDRIAQAGRDSRHDGGTLPDLSVDRAELKAIDAAMAWQNAEQARQGSDAALRAGGSTACYAEGKTPKDVADALRADAVAARADWQSKLNKRSVDLAQDKLALAKTAHDQWKTEHPYMRGSEHQSDTWKAVQAAREEVSQAETGLISTANVEAEARYRQLLATNLTPAQQNDPAALSNLFLQSSENQRVMAQAIINQHYIDYGSQPITMSGLTHLGNEVDIALGFQSDLPLDTYAPADLQNLRRNRDLFTGLSKERQEMHDTVVDKIVELGGEHAEVTVVPVVYALPGGQGGLVKTALFKVEQDKGSAKLVDEHGRVYSSARDYRANNLLPVEDVQLAMPEGADIKLDDHGNVKLFTGDARTETGWETVRRVGHLDLVAGVAGLVAGTVIAVGSLGTLSVPGGAMMVASTTLLSASAYGAVTSGQSLYNEASHGVDVNPVTNRQARMDWLNLGLSVVGTPVAGASTRAAWLGWRSARLARMAEQAGDAGEAAALASRAQSFTAQAAAWQRPAELTGKTTAVGSVVAAEEGARYMADSWESMTPAQRRQQMGMMLLNVAGFASPVFARGYVGVHNTVKGGMQAVFGPGGSKPVEGSTPAGKTTPVVAGADDEGATVIPLLRRGSSDGDGTTTQPTADSGDALAPFRPTIVRPANTAAGSGTSAAATPNNVVPLHPEGAPVVPEAPADAPLAPVLQLKTGRHPGDPTEPTTEAMSAAAEQPQVAVLKLAAGGEDASYRRAEDLPDPHKRVLRPIGTVNPRAQASNNVNPPPGNSSPVGGGNPNPHPVNPISPVGGSHVPPSASNSAPPSGPPLGKPVAPATSGLEDWGTGRSVMRDALIQGGRWVKTGPSKVVDTVNDFRTRPNKFQSLKAPFSRVHGEMTVTVGSRSATLKIRGWMAGPASFAQRAWNPARAWVAPWRQVMTVSGLQAFARYKAGFDTTSDQVVGHGTGYWPSDASQAGLRIAAGPEQTLVSQGRSWGTRYAWYRVAKNGGEKALGQALRGDIDGAVTRLERLQKRGALYGLPQEKLDAGVRVINEVREFAVAAARLNKVLYGEGVDPGVASQYRPRLSTESALQRGNVKGMQQMPEGLMLREIMGADLATLFPGMAPDQALARAVSLVDGYRQASAHAAFEALPAALRTELQAVAADTALLRDSPAAAKPKRMTVSYDPAGTTAPATPSTQRSNPVVLTADQRALVMNALTDSGMPAPSTRELPSRIRELVEQTEAYGQLSGPKRAQADADRAQVAALPEKTRAKLLVAKEGEEAALRVREMIADSTIHATKIQGAFGSSMSMTGNRWHGIPVGRLFKKGALVFPLNSGLSAVMKPFPKMGESKVEYWCNVASWPGEIIGNLPGAWGQIWYQAGLGNRAKFEVTEAGAPRLPTEDAVVGYLQRRGRKMQRLEAEWAWVADKSLAFGKAAAWTIDFATRGRWSPDAKGYWDRAAQSLQDDRVARANAQARGALPPEPNMSFTKYVLSRRENAQGRISGYTDIEGKAVMGLKEALASGDEATMRKVAKEESTRAAKSMNTSGDFMALPSMYRYIAQAVKIGIVYHHPLVAGLALFHGLASNGGWLRSQQGRGTFYGKQMAVTGLEDGNGLGGKWVARKWNAVMESPVLHGGRNEYVYAAGDKPGVGKRKVETAGEGRIWSRAADALHLTTGAEAAKNRRRVRMLVTSTLTPLAIFGVAVERLLEKDDKKPQPGGTAVDPTPTPSTSSSPAATPTPSTTTSVTPSITPSATPSQTTTSPTAPATQSPSTLPRLTPTPSTSPQPTSPTATPPTAPAEVYWTVDGAVRERSTFTNMAEAKGERDDMDYDTALDQLFNLNPQYKRSQMDGYVSPTRLDDPDALNNGTRINTGVPARG